jgi:hypothetical protein
MQFAEIDRLVTLEHYKKPMVTEFIYES